MMAQQDVAAGYAEATKLNTLQDALNLVDPPCPHFGTCGGCNYQHLQYTAQLSSKHQQVAESLHRIGGVRDCQDVLLPIIPCQQSYHYRNNMQFTFSAMAPLLLDHAQQSIESRPASSMHTQGHSSSNRLILGLHKANDPSKIIPIQTCFLQHDSANALLQTVAQAAAQLTPQASPKQSQQLSAFDPATQQGFLRQLILRRNSHNEYMVIISTTSFQPAILKPLVMALQECSVSVLSIINTVIPAHPPVKQRRKRGSVHKALNSRRQQQQQQGRSHVLHGTPTISEQLCGLEFQISPDSFFQVNSAQAEVLYELVRRAAGTASLASTCAHTAWVAGASVHNPSHHLKHLDHRRHVGNVLLFSVSSVTKYIIAGFQYMLPS